MPSKGSHVARNARRRHQRFDEIRRIKETSPCAQCGLNFPAYVLDFDHRKGEVKRAAISTLVVRYVPWAQILAEIAKCDVVCARCHRLRTFGKERAPGKHRSRAFQSTATWIDTLKTRTPCKDCGGFFTAVQMDFDHVRGVKVQNVSRLLALGRFSEIADEIQKCDLVCANCHRTRSEDRRLAGTDRGNQRTVLSVPEVVRS